MVGATRKRRTSVATDVRATGTPERRGALIARALVRWYGEHCRSLPWRARPSPYATWVSEIMLQQTQVATVLPYFARWMTEFPSVAALAQASEDAVLSAWQGLGYYSRARNLRLGAQLVQRLHGGKIPSDPVLLRQLPGIGRYTAGAIASIAFELPEPAVDGNVIRVLTRLEALRGDPRTAPVATQLWNLAADWVQCESPRLFNQALMELGALICTPENPRCAECPLLSNCRARTLGLTAKLPEIRPRPKPETRHVVVLVARKSESLLVARQPESARHWANLYTLPHTERLPKETDLAAATRLLADLDPKAELAERAPIAGFTYPITRFRFEGTVYRTGTVRAKRLATLGCRWVTADELTELAVAAPHRRLCNLILGARR
jgi:A/G-specific adenine glycosylase